MPQQDIDRIRQNIRNAYLADESSTILAIKQALQPSRETNAQIEQLALKLVTKVRTEKQGSGLDAFMQEYDLSSREGVLLLCLAEALLRIPDAKTADQLIKDKLVKANWLEHIHEKQSLFVNAGTWGLMLTGKIIQLEDSQLSDPAQFLGSLVTRLSEPVVRTAMKEAMKIISQQFVMGDQIERAIKRAQTKEFASTRFSFDMLGEAAVCQADADRYYKDYHHAIDAVACMTHVSMPIHEVASVSVKLSALHPRYEISQDSRVIKELLPRLLQLVISARQQHVAITIDAEEAHRLDLMLDVFERLITHPQVRTWNGIGLAVQAYQKRALPVLQWLDQLAKAHGCKIPLRLVKGAYWDSEIKWAQEQGLVEYPVFTRKEHTDVSYLACAQYSLQSESFYPQFASHNAHTLASIAYLAKQPGEKAYETQRLHGMGEDLYRAYRQEGDSPPCRVYAPVGAHEDLLPYLVRRLLENGANTSFINRISDTDVPVESLVANPLQSIGESIKSVLLLPADLFPGRLNSVGVNLADPVARDNLHRQLQHYQQQGTHTCNSLLDGETPACLDAAVEPDVREIRNPAKPGHKLGESQMGSVDTIDQAFTRASAGLAVWRQTGTEHRAACLEKMADLLQKNRDQLLSLLVMEAGKSVSDALAEIREAVDFCRYYAQQLRHLFCTAELPGVTGESNQLTLQGRGVFLCISPWNFPLAIFTGQLAAALAAGNTVIAKPSTQTCLIAYHAVRLFHQAGVPTAALHLVLVPGQQIESRALRNPNLAGVAFTGSTDTANRINRVLAQRPGSIVPLIAETGGINAMIVDSSALAQQVVTDVIVSAFNSAGQRCSALRVLFLQQDVADHILELLKGAMRELKLGDPADLSVDVGPVIDEAARRKLLNYIDTMQQQATLIYQCQLMQDREGYFVPPCVFEIEKLADLKQEVFGPVLHVIRYSQDQLPQVIDDINNSHYGLTLGLHSRLESNMELVHTHARVGNIYVNRNMIGATVGAQPFGGEALSGTGPKAGGPHYLLAFATERVFTVNTAAIGGNTQLLSNSESNT